MGLLGNFARSLKPGNDAQLAATQYAGRESASDRSSGRSKTFGRPSRNVAAAAKKGQDWSDREQMNSPGGTLWHRGKG